MKYVAATLALSAVMTSCQGSSDLVARSRHLSCDALVPEVIKASEHNATLNPRDWQIVGISSVRSSIGKYDYECKGMAKLSGGGFAPVGFGATDNHGNQAPIYSFEVD